MRNVMKAGLLIVILLIVFFGVLQAEMIYLKDGSKIVGKVTKSTETEVTIETAGGILTIPKDKISRIDESEESAPSSDQGARSLPLMIGSCVILLTQNETMQGKVTNQGANNITIYTESGERIVNVSDITDWKLGQTKPPKSAGTACLLSWLLPGAGMFYAGRNDLGALYLCSGIVLAGWWILAISSYDYDTYSYEAEYDINPYIPMGLLLADRVIEYIHTVVVIKEINKKGACQFTLYSDPQSHDMGLRMSLSPSSDISKNLLVGYNYQKKQTEAKLELRF